ncbi:hypothetical protein CLD22_05110 [Rubrivivax gelatinosus]|nr:hypothetical protein [Rubrivivax gelatinosus]
MPNEDEPPFPKRGMRDIVVQVGRLASQLEIEGDLTMFISVGSEGKADGFSILSAPSPEMAKAVAFIFYKTDFKPAICGGKACPGEFPFRIRLER